MVSKLIIPNKDIVIPSAPAVRELLRQDFETIERYVNSIPTSAGVTKLNGLQGDVNLDAGSGITITVVGQDITIAGTSVQPSIASVFVPGTLVASTWQEFTTKTGSVLLSQVDAYLNAAPVGSTSASCANLVVSGSGGGLVTLPFTPDQNEFHLGPGDLGAVYAASDNSPNRFSLEGDVGFFETASWTATAAGQISGFEIHFADNGTYTASDIFVAGILTPAPIPGQISPSSYTALPWALDTTGAKAFVLVPITSAVANQPAVGGHPYPDTTYTFALNNPVNIANGQTFAVALLLMSSALTFPCGTGQNVWDSTPGSSTGNASDAQGIQGKLDGAYAYVNNGANFHSRLMGGALGTTLIGKIQVATSLTGAPASPGGNANVALTIG